LSLNIVKIWVAFASNAHGNAFGLRLLGEEDAGRYDTEGR
jgi:hypothetical protein